MQKKVPKNELEQRLRRFRAIMDEKNPEWELALLIGKVNQYYFTGTMQEGLLFIYRNGKAVFYIRKSYERALDESLFPEIKQMESYRDAAAALGNHQETVYLEAELVPLAMYQRISKHFKFREFKSLDASMAKTRSVKSAYELERMTKAGDIHRRVLEDRMPLLIKEGMSEADLTAALFTALHEEGHHGGVRFAMFDTEMPIGHVTIGENSIYPSYFNGPGGSLGSCPAIPYAGSRESRLTAGKLVFIDIGCGYDGYHTDKTMTYVFKGRLPEDAEAYHRRCVELQYRIAGMLRSGEKPSNIYKTIMNSLDDDFLRNFMGYGKRKVKFLGHGIGLHVDELPVIAEGFDEPLEEGMVFALEPKVGIEGIGMVGIENTFLVTKDGGICLTGGHPGLMEIGGQIPPG